MSMRDAAICEDCGYIDWADFFVGENGEEGICPRCKSDNIVKDWAGK